MMCLRDVFTNHYSCASHGCQVIVRSHTTTTRYCQMVHTNDGSYVLVPTEELSMCPSGGQFTIRYQDADTTADADLLCDEHRLEDEAAEEEAQRHSQTGVEFREAVAREEAEGFWDSTEEVDDEHEDEEMETEEFDAEDHYV